MSEEATTNESKKRTFEGVVVSDKMDKTIVVRVERMLKHPKYGKYYEQDKTYHVHDEENAYSEGDTVQFIECRPYSRTKRWRVLETEVK
jgi:small subunit ribosomal protein S17